MQSVKAYFIFECCLMTGGKLKENRWFWFKVRPEILSCRSITMQPFWIYSFRTWIHFSTRIPFHRWRSLSAESCGALLHVRTRGKSRENRVKPYRSVNLKSKFQSFHLNQKPTKIFLYFCPSFKKPLKSGRNKRQKH